MLEVTGHLKLD